MKKFAFTMQALYDVKKAGEKQALAEFAAARNRLQQLEEKTDACRTALERGQSRLEEQAKCGIPACDFQNACTYLKGQRQELLALEEESCRARDVAAEKQQALRKIHQDGKALEHLRETQYRSFLAEQNAREARETEDLLMPGMLKRLEKRDNPA